MQCLPGTPCHQYIVAHLYITETPEDRRVAPGTIKVSIDDRAPSLPGKRPQVVPTYIFPGMLCGCCQITIRPDTYRLNGRIDFNGWNNQAYWNKQG